MKRTNRVRTVDRLLLFRALHWLTSRVPPCCASLVRSIHRLISALLPVGRPFWDEPVSQDIWHPRIYGTPIPYILGYVAPPSDIWYPHTNYPRTFSTPHAFELQLYFNISKSADVLLDHTLAGMVYTLSNHGDSSDTQRGHCR